LGHRVEVGVIRLDDLITADEAFFTGTAAEVTPIRELDDMTIGGGARGPVTETIQRRFFDAVMGRERRYRDWLHMVGIPAPLGV
ncbi:MAG TPA: branched chain amino acid aminotransferase, partial [Blastocatellia bacterium]|nr:branched chain amino acid aminotransferase [Blastocatellia bacterium]